ncbi:MAG: isocitrate lyase/phosphoenolpyruvate mutase family protein [Candidatus Dormibacteraeota bacterium]|nr:isocitrate lyase/phosphoenolpyruvate mutase family protein [Candidatus Dormibacteraeota bacterium]MBV9526235.1 isocitrate lyase/phosphoenolpyruvate mutase family protein [Candidatus Dormibacteraeota bacterium]
MTLPDVQAKKAAAFSALHKGNAFVIPNPWDAGSARVLAGMGFSALATTSSGFAFTLGRRDGRTTLEEVAAHIQAVDAAVDLPVSADLENGYGADPESAARAVLRAAEAGAVGGSIEDFDPDDGIYDIEHAVDRVAAAVQAAHSLGFPFMLTARAENHIRGRDDVRDTIRRLQAFQDAGADVLYAPGLRNLDDIREVCASTARPVNVLALPGMRMRDLADAGVRRVSLGGSLTWVAVTAVMSALSAIRDDGDFSRLTGRPPVDGWLG